MNRDRPLSARSVMASLLLGRRPAQASGRDLVRWCGLFGISAGTARVALHRMTAAGELRRDERGYVLVGGLAQRQREQESRLDSYPARWNGRWRMAVAVGRGRPAAVRADVRVELRRAGLAEWREGVWIRPANLVDLVEDPRCAWLDTIPDDDPIALANQLFGPERWRRRADELLDRLGPTRAAMTTDPEANLADAFLAGAATLGHIRADPRLPTRLLPAPWPGTELRNAYRLYQREFAVVARAWFRGPERPGSVTEVGHQAEVVRRVHAVDRLVAE